MNIFDVNNILNLGRNEQTKQRFWKEVCFNLYCGVKLPEDIIKLFKNTILLEYIKKYLTSNQKISLLHLNPELIELFI